MIGFLLLTSVQEDNSVSRPDHVVLCCRCLQKISDVVAGSEHSRTTGQNETADHGIGLSRVDRIAHGEIHFLRQRVLFFWTPHRNRACGLLVGNDDVLGHGSSLTRSARLWRVREAAAALADEMLKDYSFHPKPPP
jgi:hypothetical protein